jgi:hypothetical protein
MQLNYKNLVMFKSLCANNLRGSYLQVTGRDFSPGIMLRWEEGAVDLYLLTWCDMAGEYGGGRVITLPLQPFPATPEEAEGVVRAALRAYAQHLLEENAQKTSDEDWLRAHFGEGRVGWLVPEYKEGARWTEAEQKGLITPCEGTFEPQGLEQVRFELTPAGRQLISRF